MVEERLAVIFARRRQIGLGFQKIELRRHAFAVTDLGEAQRLPSQCQGLAVRFDLHGAVADLDPGQLDLREDVQFFLPQRLFVLLLNGLRLHDFAAGLPAVVERDLEGERRFP